MTGRKAGLLLAAVAVLTVTIHAQMTSRSELSLQAAIRQELVDGDLKGAIEQFKRLAHDSNPLVAAEALLHLASCYDKLGQKADARATYERVIGQHSNQKKAVAEARTWLDANPAGATSSVRLEQVWATKDVSSAGRPSNDGRYLAFVDRTSGNGNLAVRDLVTGENRLLTSDAGPHAWAAGPVISPDGKQIAYRWEGGKDDSIRLIRSDGTNMRVLTRREYGDFLGGWSPDGRHIAAIHYNYSTDRGVQIILISTVDGSVTPLKSTGWQEPAIGGFSPDGRFLVYSLSPDENGNSAVFALAVDGSRETSLVAGLANNWSPLWSADGSRVVFLSNRSGSPGLWSIRVADGKPVGEPELLRANVVGAIPLGVTNDGSYYYRSGNLWRDAYQAQIDPDTLTISKLTLITDRFVGSNFDPVPSPDGRYVAFLRQASDQGSRSGQALIVKSVATGDERTVAIGTPLVSYGRLLWFPDGRSLLTLDRANNRPRFRAIDVETSAARTLFESPVEVWNTVALSTDGNALFYTRAELLTSRTGPGDLKNIRLMKRRLDTGEETELHRTQSTGLGYFGLTLSADGSTLAFSLNISGRQRALMVMSADGGTPREIYRAGIYDMSHTGAMIWTRDGRHLIITARCGPGDLQFCGISSAGGPLRPLGPGTMEITTRTMSADGRRLLFTSETRSPELWVMRDILINTAKVR